MISALLLVSEASAAPQPTPYAVYATLAVGILSLIASGLNIYFSSKTAQKVVNLSTKTTREVAELSAQVSRESAGLAAQTAREIKEADYKNDYYKKVIDKRLKAIETLENFTSLFLASTRIMGTENRFHSFFEEDDMENIFGKSVDEIARYNIWYSIEVAIEMREFTTYVLVIINSAKNLQRKEKINYLIEERKSIQSKVIALQKLIASDMYKLYEVDAFFKSRLN